MFLKNLFFSDTYSLAYRYNCKDILSKAPFNVIKYKNNEWYADPFLFEYKDEIYLFCEIMNKNIGRGTIGVKKINEFSYDKDFKIVLKEKFHLSYPMVFKFQNEIYMIPETCGCRQLRLYKCENFPSKWQLYWVIKENVDYVDTTIYTDSDYCMIETFDKIDNKNKIFKLDIDDKSVTDCTFGNFLDKRPGGGYFIKEGLYHALQNCDNAYGDYLHFCLVKTFDEHGLDETEQFVYKINDVVINDSKKYSRIHTYNRCGKVEVIDLCFSKFDLRNFFPKLIKSLKYKLTKKCKY